MKRLMVLIALISLFIITAGVTADEKTETIMDVVVVEETSTENLFSPEARAEFADVFQKILLVTEEAFGYLLSGNAEEKQVFLSEYSSLEDDYAMFESTIDLNATEYAEMAELFSELNIATDAVGTTAETMFTSYEENQEITLEEVIAFEDAVDNATSYAHQIWILNSESGTQPLSVEAYQDRLISTLLHAAEEAYAYPILDDEIEKGEALDNFVTFDTIAAEFSENYPEESCEDLKTIKDELMTCTEAMFTAYETNGVVTADEFEAFEEVLEDKFTYVYVLVEFEEVLEEENTPEEI